MIIITNKFPFIKFQKKFKSENYKIITLNNNKLTNNQITLIKSCKNILLENQIQLNKIKFVCEQSFMYDIDNNVINPKYQRMIPIKIKRKPIIDISKPQNIMTIFLGENRTDNNFELLKKLTKNTKKGIVMLANNSDLNDVMWLANLDNAIDYYYRVQNFENYDID
jgi:hypothetical protein